MGCEYDGNITASEMVIFSHVRLIQSEKQHGQNNEKNVC